MKHNWKKRSITTRKGKLTPKGQALHDAIICINAWRRKQKQALHRYGCAQANAIAAKRRELRVQGIAVKGTGL